MGEDYGPDYFREAPDAAEFRRLDELPLDALLEQVAARAFGERSPVWEVLKLRAGLERCGWMLYAIALDGTAEAGLRREAIAILRAKTQVLDLDAFKTSLLDDAARRDRLKKIRAVLEEKCGPPPGGAD